MKIISTYEYQQLQFDYYCVYPRWESYLVFSFNDPPALSIVAGIVIWFAFSRYKAALAMSIKAFSTFYPSIAFVS